MQVDPVQPKLKTPGTQRLKLNRDVLLSTSAFKFNLRRYSEGTRMKGKRFSVGSGSLFAYGIMDQAGWVMRTLEHSTDWRSVDQPSPRICVHIHPEGTVSLAGSSDLGSSACSQ